MKLIVIISFAFIAFTGCKKEDKQYCAECVEQNTQTKANTFCGTSSEVDEYISGLKQQGSNFGQNWKCTKK